MQSEIIPRPAANQRSPNRKARTRRFLKASAFAAKREGIAQEVAVGKTLEEAAQAVGLTLNSVGHMLSRIPGFKERIEEAQKVAAERRAEAQGYIDSEVLSIAKIVVQKIKNPKTADRVVVGGGIQVLKGRGVLEGEGVNVAVGVKVGITADDMVRAYLEAKKALASGNGNTDSQ